MSALLDHAALFIDQPHVAAQTKGDPSRPWERLRLDFGRLAHLCFQLAQASCDEGRYLAAIRPCLDPKHPIPPEEADRILAGRRHFLTALQERCGFVVLTAEPVWEGDPAAPRHLNPKATETALAIQMARLLYEREDITHLILVAGSPSFVPVVRLAHEYGASVTLVQLSRCKVLEEAVDRTKAITRAQLHRLAERKETALRPERSRLVAVER